MNGAENHNRQLLFQQMFLIMYYILVLDEFGYEMFHKFFKGVFFSGFKKKKEKPLEGDSWEKTSIHSYEWNILSVASKKKKRNLFS